MNSQFYIQQERLQTRSAAASLRGQAVQYAPSFSPAILCDVEPLTDLERLQAYERKAFSQKLAKIDKQRLSACRMKVKRRIAKNRIEDRRDAA